MSKQINDTTQTIKKSDRRALIGAAFIMGTSAIGPGFLTQTATFTEQLGANFGFVILVATIICLIVQLNVWRVISVSGLRGQDIANKVKPGLGNFIAILIVLGGIAFNTGNIGGAALGLNVLFGIDTKISSLIGTLLVLAFFFRKDIANMLDKLSTLVAGVMIILMAYVVFRSQPPVLDAILSTFVPTKFDVSAILTIVGGTVGGYITFSGGHRLLDAHVTGTNAVNQVDHSASSGIGVSTVMRILLFLASLGVVSQGVHLDPNNPAATVFQSSVGQFGYIAFGILMFTSGLNAITGCSYTSISFIKTLIPWVNKNERWSIIILVLIAELIFLLVGQPAQVLVIVGALNGMILPLTLGSMLIASRRINIVGDYKHSKLLTISGWIVVVLTAFMAVRTFITLFV
ncbi:divalent metal cation transporter [Aerococcus agrisoli]|uniref:Divalent metal cation transporter n=1 Tax=Aerococcus agrisoli TaxID=2487350 RepID=A0A3N4H608_9LACT|nr:NRAMP family divalent metal transporter [Aerococcus agrisoli]RPA60584.1 divalent metal cation transporter [Aerococcus agrisoli]